VPRRCGPDRDAFAGAKAETEQTVIVDVAVRAERVHDPAPDPLEYLYLVSCGPNEFEHARDGIDVSQAGIRRNSAQPGGIGKCGGEATSKALPRATASTRSKSRVHTSVKPGVVRHHSRAVEFIVSLAKDSATMPAEASTR
jgi:hypothetical protein